VKNSLKQEIFSRKKQNLLQKGQYYFVQYIKQFWAICDNCPFARWRRFTTATRMLQGFAFLCKLGLLLFNPRRISKFKYERKNEKYSGRSGKMTPSCKWPIPDYFRCTKTNEEIRPLPTVYEEPSKHLTVFSSETVNIKKLANLTANTRNYGQITLNPIQTLVTDCIGHLQKSKQP